MMTEKYLWFTQHGAQAHKLGFVSDAKMEMFIRYKTFLNELKRLGNNTDALYSTAELCCCDFITAYKAVHFFQNGKINLKEK